MGAAFTIVGPTRDLSIKRQGKTSGVDFDSGEQVMKRVIGFLATSVFITVAFSACSENRPPYTDPSPEEPSSIIQSDPDLTSFANALTRADLIKTTDSNEQFLIILAPTDSAFEKLYEELSVTEENFLNREDLPTILNYHLADVGPKKAIVQNGETLTTLEGGTIIVSVPNDDHTKAVFNEEANTLAVYEGNLRINNAVIYVVDNVLMPSADK